MLSQALSVFDFLKIKYKGRHHILTLYVIPALVGMAFAVLSFYLKQQGIIIFVHERFGDIFTFLAVLPGFYIASLAAIGTISKASIDEYINEPNTPYLIKQEPNRADPYEQPLTRRLFLSLLFAYLASTSLLLAIFLIAIRFYLSVAEPTIYLILLFYFVVFFILTQILLLSLVGISYLGYKSLASN